MAFFDSSLPFDPVAEVMQNPELQRFFAVLKTFAFIILVLYVIEHVWKWYSDFREKRKINKILKDVEDIKLRLSEIETMLKSKGKKK